MVAAGQQPYWAACRCTWSLVIFTFAFTCVYSPLAIQCSRLSGDISSAALLLMLAIRDTGVKRQVEKGKFFLYHLYVECARKLVNRVASIRPLTTCWVSPTCWISLLQYLPARPVRRSEVDSRIGQVWMSWWLRILLRKPPVSSVGFRIVQAQTSWWTSVPTPFSLI